jgi:hypothetical protein
MYLLAESGDLFWPFFADFSFVKGKLRAVRGELALWAWQFWALRRGLSTIIYLYIWLIKLGLIYAESWSLPAAGPLRPIVRHLVANNTHITCSDTVQQYIMIELQNNRQRPHLYYGGQN